MNKQINVPERRVLYILHRGLVQIRLLAMAGRAEQIRDLADVLEAIPGFLSRLDSTRIEVLRFGLKTYQSKYPGEAFDYISLLDSDDEPPAF